MRPRLHARRIKKGADPLHTRARTLAELFVAIQDQVLPAEDHLVVEVASGLFRSGRIKYAAL